ncbi:Aste57867_14702 [Aphanomyces stellatus]|uniref:Aste57867_14702 protein n=1 Tax=Aphanomyces stellatus TaxID=120398 RepID=A0A485L330_9STRA|nr:hypothetical protein As57867_014647 [Aphanomyces stellatus]VFT91520.1 Aste57867_14702 [Aphanomyces stellatus]
MLIKSFLAACVLSSVAAQDASTPILPQALSSLIDSTRPLIASFASTALPATVGNCSAAAKAPTPCTDVGNLYTGTTSFYNIQARWISGLNKVTIDKLTLTSDSTTGLMTINAAATFANLPLSLRIDACLPGVGCSNVADDTTTCCGASKTIALSVTAACSETYPYLQNLTVTDAQVLPSLDIMITVSGKQMKIFDATKLVNGQLKTQGTVALQTQAASFINEQIKNIYGAHIFCTAASQQAWLAAHPTTTKAPAATPAPNAKSIASVLAAPAAALLVLAALAV